MATTIEPMPPAVDSTSLAAERHQRQAAPFVSSACSLAGPVSLSHPATQQIASAIPVNSQFLGVDLNISPPECFDNS